MDHVYPPGPTTVPPNLTAATAAYKRHAWLAMLGLTAFIVLYFALSAWFAWTAWRLFSGMFGADGNFELWGFVAAICATFLAVFMLKALFFLQHRYDIEDIEITRAEHPRLFEFIDRLADEARAPRAHKVYLSPRVNAAVFYDLSLLNLIIPSKKNLEIGLGLVNVVTLGELKAVLAHEFGHFAQRSMAVGRWVYISQQIAGHIVARRDALDRLLQQLSRVDLRIAWVGWLLSIIVWSIRSMMDVLFRVVLLAQRALSRQMEFQADLVAVSLTGSDALIHALHRLNAADDAWDKTISFANTEANAKRGVTDLFAVQARIIERMREILNQPTYGIVPPLPDTAREAHRVFKTELAQPPRMWATHPPSADREHNAKQRYVAAPVDERSAWDLFSDPQKLKEQMSAHVFRSATVEPVPMEQSFERLQKLYGRAFLDRSYCGTYLNRSPVRHVQTAAELYGTPVAPADLTRVLGTLYPAELAQQIEQVNEKREEKAALEALRDQVAHAPGGVIRHNGTELRRNQLPAVIAALEREISEINARIEAHDKLCRSAHLAAAQVLQKGWPEYLQGLAATLHYADHTHANLRDVQGYVSNIYHVVTADGRVSGTELTRLIRGCQELYSVLQAVYTDAPQVTLDRTLLRRLEVENWPAMLEEFKLQAPNRDNIGDWLNVIDGWIAVALGALTQLRDASLEQLLLTESQVAKFARENMQPGDAPPPSCPPHNYATLLPGKERPRQKKLDWWDRFQTADGVIPTIARSAVALGIVGAVIAVGAYVGVSNLTIYNALALPVLVEVADQQIEAQPFTPITVSVPEFGRLQLRALSADHEVIESFEEELHGANAKYVYNVAGGVPLVEWTAVYSSGIASLGGNAPPTRPLGARRWFATSVDHIFEQPPESIQVKENSNGYRNVLEAASSVSPGQQAEMLTDAKEREQLVLTHARWDRTDSPHIFEWLGLAAPQPGFAAVFAQRLKQNPSDVVLLRFEQDNAEGDAHAAVCARQGALAAAAPTDPDLQYLRIRCIDDPAARDAELLAAQKKWATHPWLVMAAAATHAELGDYRAAAPLYERSYQVLPAMREYLVVDTARVRRLTADQGQVNLEDLRQQSERLSMWLQIESGNGLTGTPLAPYAALARGDLEAAARDAAAADNVPVRMLAAASDGATPELVEAAFALPVDDSSGIESMFAMYGVAARTRHDPAPYAERINTMLGERGRWVLEFLETVRRGGDPLRARAALPTVQLQLRLHALNAAVIMLEGRAPSGWRDEVARGLFVGERQYLR